MHELALAHGGAGLHAGYAGGALVQAQPGHARRDGAGGDDQVFVLAEIELIDHRAQQVGVNLAAGSDEAGADFDDDSHAIETFIFNGTPLTWNGIAPEAGEGFRLCLFHYRSCRDRGRGPGGEGQYSYPAIKMAFWQDEKSCYISALCLLRTPPAASLTG